MTTPTVSILTTIYNRAQYLPDCIRSVLALTYTDWELILVDDCSTDDSFAVAEEWAGRDDRIRAYCNEQNLGDYPNRNRAASLAKGLYLKYLDADDIFYPHGLQVMVEAMEAFPAAAFGLSFNRFDDALPYPQCVHPDEAYRLYFLGDGIFGTGPSASIILRDRFLEVGGFRPIRHDGDNDLWLRLAARYPTVKLQPSLVWWRRHEGQEHERRRPDGAHFRLCWEALEAGVCPLSPEDVRRAKQRLRRRHARRVLRLAGKQARPVAAWRLAHEAGLNATDVLGGLFRGGRPAPRTPAHGDER